MACKGSSHATDRTMTTPPCRRRSRVRVFPLLATRHPVPCQGRRLLTSPESSLQEAVSLPVQSRLLPVAARQPGTRSRKQEAGSWIRPDLRVPPQSSSARQAAVHTVVRRPRCVCCRQARRDGLLKRHLFDWREEGVPMQIAVVGPDDLPELLPLMRAYCDFYQVAPEDQALLADPQREGLQLLARDDAGRAVGFATLYWTWQTLAAARVGVMNDLYVAAEARGTGVADGLVAACLERCREHGATHLTWQTARDNHRAQAVYERIGATREDRWLDYELSVDPG